MGGASRRKHQWVDHSDAPKIEHDAPKGIYNFDANGPILTDEDEKILDKIWDDIGKRRAKEKGKAKADDVK